jgi:Fe-S-cluster containining protein
MPQLIDSLPAIYRGRVAEFLHREVPTETKATCDDCAMCDQRRAVPAVDGQSRLFRSDTKCCTYYPKLPNYLVGALLGDASTQMAEGQRRVREKIASRMGISPQWVRPPQTYALHYREARAAFGRTRSLRCPYYDEGSGGCTIWAHREAVCSTYFCRYEKGEDGMAMWMQLKAYLALVELQLSRYAVYQLLPEYVLDKRDTADPPPLTGADLDDQPPSDKDYGALWGDWAGREETFYRRCHEIVLGLDRAAIERILGIDGTLALAVLERRHQAAIEDVLPATLTFDHNATVRWLPDNVVALGAYSDLDALALDASAYQLLVAFDGTKSVHAVRQQLRNEKQADLSDDVLLQLYRHRILK